MRFDAQVVKATGVRSKPSPCARRVLKLLTPTQPPRGTLEEVAGQLVARAAPFDQPAASLMLRQWGLPGSTPSPLIGYLDPPAVTANTRLVGVRRQLRRLTAESPPPTALLDALAVSAQQPNLSEERLRAALAGAKLSDGAAGTPLLLALAELWTVPLPPSLHPPEHVREQLAALTKDVRIAGALPREPVPAVHVRQLRDAGVRPAAGWLVAENDRTSQLARPIRRQLAAAGALTAAELLTGARRQRPRLTQLEQSGVLAWARAQPDLAIDGDHLRLKHNHEQWLRATDPCVLALFPGRFGPIPRTRILEALVGAGMLRASAEVWVVRCAWLRPAGTRGYYVLAGPAGRTTPEVAAEVGMPH